MEIVELTRTQAADAAGLLTRAFAEDAHFQALHPSASRRRRAMPHMFRAATLAALSFRGAFGAVEEGRILGVALWLPPGRSPVSGAAQPRALLESLLLLAADPSAVGRQLRFARAALQLRPTAPHWYLEALGVDRAHRGRGVGSQLVLAGTRRADRVQVGAYLETSTESAAALYGRQGFTTLRRDVRLTSGGPPFWLMWRPPAVIGANGRR